MGILYRAKQFWQALNAHLSQAQLSEVEQVISPQLFKLFLSMQPSEQLHSYKVYTSLKVSGEQDPDLLIAALLHDIGKTRYPLHIWERVLIVLGKKIFPDKVKTWGNAEPKGLKRAFVVAEKHPAWGAEMVAGAGASGMTINLIKRHQTKTPFSLDQTISAEDRLLYQLQSRDEES